MTETFDVFLSHNNRDKPAVIELGEALRDRGLNPWLDCWHMPPGKPWLEELQGMMEEIPAALVIVGKDGMGPWEQVETESLLIQCADRRLPIIPVLLPRAPSKPELPTFLKRLTWVDLREGLSSEGLSRLVWGITGQKPDDLRDPRHLRARGADGKGLFRVSNLPRQNPLFIGREGLLSDIQSGWIQSSPSCGVQALIGLGGAGKSQLAFQYAYQHHDLYDVVWWIRAEEPTTLASDFSSLALALDLPAENVKDQQMVANMVRHWLRRHDRWLLIFDNATGADSVEPYLLPESEGHVIVTSRNPLWGTWAIKRDVPKFNADEAAHFLLNHTGQQDRESALSIAEELGFLPLALEHTRAYVEAKHRSLASYLELLRSHRKDLLARGSSDQQPLTATWELSFQQLESESPIAVELLQCCAFMAPEDVQCSMLAKGEGILSEDLLAVLSNPLTLDEVVESLLRYSLVAYDGEALGLHRLVRHAIRDRLSEEDQRAWAEKAVVLMHEVFPFDKNDLTTWPDSDRWMPHAWATTEGALSLGVGQRESALLLRLMGRNLFRRADFEGSRTVLEKALKVQKSLSDEEDLDLAQTLHDLGVSLHGLGQLEAGLDLLTNGLEIREQLLDEESEGVAESLSSLSSLNYTLGRFDLSLSLEARALSVRKAVLGEEHPATADSLFGIGSSLVVLGRLGEGKEATAEALRIRQLVFGSRHHATASALAQLGAVFQEEGDLDRAEKYQTEGLETLESLYGPHHPNLAAPIGNLGRINHDRQDHEKSKIYFKRALEIRNRALGENHYKTALNLNNLGLAHFSLKEFAEAIPCLERSLSVQEATLGDRHSNIVKILLNLGTAKARIFRFKEAKKHLTRARTLCKIHHSHQESMMREIQAQLSLVSHGSGSGEKRKKKPKKRKKKHKKKK